MVFSCIHYSRLKAFEKKRENKTYGKICHSAVYQHINLMYPMAFNIGLAIVTQATAIESA